ncbi:MAG: hypothetical protein J6Z03_05705 [Erysipelotrichaceae bacterium]|nr:hypothetical protein [Erysipelotrichaceae bacterium]
MADQKIDMFKLVEEVEKQKSVDLDEIFNDLDLVKSAKDEQSEVRTEPKARKAEDMNLVSKPIIPNNIGPYDTRFDAFKGIIEHVSYGTDGVYTYIEGHKTALEKYFKDAYNNSKDLYVIEARVNDEINKTGSYSGLYEKGYYDGLVYVMKALKRSKELLMAKINDKIKAAL